MIRLNAHVQVLKPLNIHEERSRDTSKLLKASLNTDGFPHQAFSLHAHVLDWRNTELKKAFWAWWTMGSCQNSPGIDASWKVRHFTMYCAKAIYVLGASCCMGPGRSTSDGRHSLKAVSVFRDCLGLQLLHRKAAYLLGMGNSGLFQNIRSYTHTLPSSKSCIYPATRKIAFGFARVRLWRLLHHRGTASMHMQCTREVTALHSGVLKSILQSLCCKSIQRLL